MEGLPQFKEFNNKVWKGKGTYSETRWVNVTPGEDVIPYQVGPTCMYHAIATSTSGTYAVFYGSEGRKVPYKCLSVQHLRDSSDEFRKSFDSSKARALRAVKDGILPVEDYSVLGMRGHHLWKPAKFRGNRPLYPVKVISITDVYANESKHILIKEKLKKGPIYADFILGAKEYARAKDQVTPHRGLRISASEAKRIDDKDLINHSVAIFGYGTYKPYNGPEIHYYVYCNTYGDKWGDKGYGRIECRGICTVAIFRVPKRVPHLNIDQTPISNVPDEGGNVPDPEGGNVLDPSGEGGSSRAEPCSGAETQLQEQSNAHDLKRKREMSFGVPDDGRSDAHDLTDGLPEYAEQTGSKKRPKERITVIEAPRQFDPMIELMLRPQVVVTGLAQLEAVTSSAFKHLLGTTKEIRARQFLGISNRFQLSSLPSSNVVLKYLAKKQLPSHAAIIWGLLKNQEFEEMDSLLCISAKFGAGVTIDISFSGVEYSSNGQGNWVLKRRLSKLTSSNPSFSAMHGGLFLKMLTGGLSFAFLALHQPYLVDTIQSFPASRKPHITIKYTIKLLDPGEQKPGDILTAIAELGKLIGSRLKHLKERESGSAKASEMIEFSSSAISVLSYSELSISDSDDSSPMHKDVDQIFLPMPTPVKAAMFESFAREIVTQSEIDGTPRIQQLKKSNYGFSTDSNSECLCTDYLVVLFNKLVLCCIHEGRSQCLLTGTRGNYVSAAKLMKANIVNIPTNSEVGFKLTEKVLTEVIGAASKTWVYISGPRVNPTDLIYCNKEMERILSVCAKFGARVVTDISFLGVEYNSNGWGSWDLERCLSKLTSSDPSFSVDMHGGLFFKMLTGGVLFAFLVLNQPYLVDTFHSFPALSKPNSTIKLSIKKLLDLREQKAGGILTAIEELAKLLESILKDLKENIIHFESTWIDCVKADKIKKSITEVDSLENDVKIYEGIMLILISNLKNLLGWEEEEWEAVVSNQGKRILSVFWSKIIGYLLKDPVVLKFCSDLCITQNTPSAQVIVKQIEDIVRVRHAIMGI